MVWMKDTDARKISLGKLLEMWQHGSYLTT
jgi:hypothetical protein